MADTLLAWLEWRDRIVSSPGILFPRLGRQHADGSFPDASARVEQRGVMVDDGRLSAAALRDIVRPVMLVGVPAELAHPHVLPHTYGTLFLAQPKARIEQLQKLMRHADISTTSVYLHQSASDLEAVVLAYHQPGRAALAADARRRRQRARPA